MTAKLTAELIAQAAQASVLAIQVQHGTAVAGATKREQAKTWFATFLAAMLPSVPSVLLGVLAPSAVQAGYESTNIDGTYAQATQAAATAAPQQ